MIIYREKLIKCIPDTDILLAEHCNAIILVQVFVHQPSQPENLTGNTLAI